MSNASDVEVVTMPSISDRSRLRGMIPSPIPGTPWVPHRSSEMSGHSAGSAGVDADAGSWAFSACATPLIHPPVPCAATTACTAPPVCSQISSPDAPLRRGVVGVLELRREEVAAGLGRHHLAHPRDREIDVGPGPGGEHERRSVAWIIFLRSSLMPSGITITHA